MLFEPVRKTQDAMHFKKVHTKDGEMWMPCGPREAGARQTTMTELAAEGLASKVRVLIDAVVFILISSTLLLLGRQGKTPSLVNSLVPVLIFTRQMIEELELLLG